MSILVSICLLMGIAYLLLFLLYLYGWYRSSGFSLPEHFVPQTRISVIVPARNEAHQIKACLQAIRSQQYPQELLELIVVDDHSTDDTAAIARQLPGVRVLSLAEHLLPGEAVVAYKKKALATGIAHSSGQLIVTTDADCIAGPDWLRHLAALQQHSAAELIVAPVGYSKDGSLCGLFQLLDFMTMQGITAATVRLRLGIMCNGANLAFTRNAFDAVDGYSGVEHIISGDDYLLMMKIRQRFPTGIRYLKAPAAIVHTAPQPGWAAFFRQRIRWASKTGKYDDKGMTLILLLVYLFNLSLALLAAAALLSGDNVALGWAGLLLLAKTGLEICFLAGVSRFFGQQKTLIAFPLLQPLHIFYIIVAGFLSTVGKYTWKDRTIQQT